MRNAVVSTINALDKEIHHNLLNHHTEKQTPIDTCLKWAPFAFLLACDAYGLKTRNTYKERIKHSMLSRSMPAPPSFDTTLR